MPVGLRSQLAEPWGIVAAGALGGLGGAAVLVVSTLGAPVAVPVGLGVAAAAYGLRVGAGLLAERNAPDPEDLLPMPVKGSPAEVWLRRAEKAVRTLREQTAAVDGGPVREQVGAVGDQAADTLSDLRRLAGQVASVDAARARIDVPRLSAERGRLADALRGSAPGADDQARDAARADRERTLTAVQEQLQVADRLAAARDTVVARMQSTTTGLEGLVARAAEVLAMSASTGGSGLSGDRGSDRIRALSDDLDGLRAGLAETEALSRLALGQGRTGPDG